MILIVHERLEREFERFSEQFNSFPLPDAHATLVISPCYTKLGMPNFYDPIPAIETHGFACISSNSIRSEMWQRFVLGDMPGYRFSSEKCLEILPPFQKVAIEKNKLVEKSASEIGEEIAVMIKDIDFSATWLESIAGTQSSLMELARDASCDLNKAISFGPAWPFKLSFLLSQGS